MTSSKPVKVSKRLRDQVQFGRILKRAEAEQWPSLPWWRCLLQELFITSRDHAKEALLDFNHLQSPATYYRDKAGRLGLKTNGEKRTLRLSAEPDFPWWLCSRMIGRKLPGDQEQLAALDAVEYQRTKTDRAVIYERPYGLENTRRILLSNLQPTQTYPLQPQGLSEPKDGHSPTLIARTMAGHVVLIQLETLGLFLRRHPLAVLHLVHRPGYVQVYDDSVADNPYSPVVGVFVSVSTNRA